MRPLTPNACARCGATMHPVLDPVAVGSGSGTGPLSAEPAVRLACPSCPEVCAPSLGPRD